MAQILREAMQAARRLSASPVFVVVAILSLALGMGVTSTAFSLLSAVLFRPLPFPESDRLVDVFEHNPVEVCAGCTAGTSWPNYVELRDQVKSLERVVAYRGQDFVWEGAVASERVRGAGVSGGFFQVMGGRITLGRDLSEADDSPGSQRVVVLGERFWRERLGGTPQVLGTVLRLDGVDYTVVGVLGNGFAFTSDNDVWVPLGPLAADDARDAKSLSAYGRLRSGTDLGSAAAELDALGERFEAEYPEQSGWSMHVQTLRDSLVADYEVSFWAFLGAVALVLLAAAANLSGLFLVRAADRQRETNVRAALGASRGALVRSLLAEGVVIAVLGWAAGLLVALWGIELALHLVEGALAPWIQVRLDWRVVVFSGMALGAATLLFGLLPAWKGSRHEVMSALRSGGGAGSALGHGRLRRTMVGAQVALAITLATGAGLFLHRIEGVNEADPGYDVAKLLAVEVETGVGQNVEQRTAAMDRALETVRGLGGVESAAASNFYILDIPGVGVEAEGVADDAARLAMRAAKLITPGYFATLGIPLVRGRDLSPADAAGEPAAVVNQALAARLWQEQDAIGKRVRLGGTDQPWTVVVGVVADVRTGPTSTDFEPQLYLSYARYGDSNPPGLAATLHARTQGDPTQLATRVRDALGSLGRDALVVRVQTENARLADLFWPAVLMTRFVAGLAAFTVFLSLMGIAGVVAHSLERKTREFAVRAALGATNAGLTRTAVREAMGSTAFGVVGGALLSILLIQVMKDVVIDVAVIDPLVQIGTAALFSCAAGLTAFAVARRVTRLDPIEALKSD